MINQAKAIHILKQINDLEKYLISNPQKYYLSSRMIYDHPAFLDWKGRVKNLLREFNQNALIEETINTLDGFNGYNDEQLFSTLKVQIELILNSIENLIPARNDESTTPKVPSIFISYNESSGADFVSELKMQISKKANLHIYKDDVHAWESLKEFMKTIRHRDFVILVITDQYLRSEACLYEITELIKDDNWEEKTMFCVLDNSIYDKRKHIKYIKYWNKQAKDLDQEINQIPNSASSSQCERLKQLRRATDEIGQFLEEVSDSNNPNQYSAIRMILERLEGVHNE